MNHGDKKIVVILGPTASGKTKLAVELAIKFNGEIVSADSRQVYKGMDIGTGKDLQEFSIFNSQFSKKIQIPYYLIDVASPKKQFDLSKYQMLAFEAIDDILKRGKLPILAGGSGLYIQAVVDNYKLSNIKRNLALRKKLEKLNTVNLFNLLSKRAPKIAAKLNNSDKNNKRRLIRYLEIIQEDKSFKSRRGMKKYDALIIGLNPAPEILKQRIAKRLILRLKEQNLIGEVARLHSEGLSWKKLISFGLEYKFISLYLEKKLSYEEMVSELIAATYQFSRRQLSWFRRWERQGEEINWINDLKRIKILINDFLT